MADNPDSSDPGSRPRPKATIDLTATEIPPASEAQEWSEASAYGETRAGHETGSEPELSGAEPAPDTMQGEAARTAAAAGTYPASPSHAAATRGTRLWTYLGAGIAGGAVMGGVALALWLNGALPVRETAAPAADATWNALAARLSSVESQVRSLPKAAPDANPAALEDLNRRLAKLESAGPAAAAPDAVLTARLDQTESAVKSLAADLQQLHQRADENTDAARQAVSRAESAAAEAAQNAARSAGAERQDIDRIGSQVAALEQGAKAAQAEIAKQAAVMLDAQALRFAIAAAALKSAVDAGQPFRAELNAVKSAGAKVDLSPLEPFADSGVPRAAALGRELSDLAPAMLRATEPPSAGTGFLDRLQSHAKQLVRIRRVDDTPGDDPSTVIGRMELKAAQGDLTSAAAEIGKLPPAARAPAEAWLAKAQARLAAIELSRRLEADALSNLAKQAS